MLLTHDPNMEMNLSQEATPSTSTSSGVDLCHHISPEKSLSKTPDWDELQENIKQPWKGKEHLANYLGRGVCHVVGGWCVSKHNIKSDFMISQGSG